jgi:cytochrome c-type biogenesis protein CcmH/NrfF/Flp pilus assembly protein TadD
VIAENLPSSNPVVRRGLLLRSWERLRATARRKSWSLSTQPTPVEKYLITLKFALHVILSEAKNLSSSSHGCKAKILRTAPQNDAAPQFADGNDVAASTAVEKRANVSLSSAAATTTLSTRPHYQKTIALGSLVPALLLLAKSILVAAAPDLEDQTRTIATELRCVVCQNLSVADSPSEMAQQMRGVIREQLREGKSPQEIKNYFVSKYGEWVLLKPEKSGFSLVVWLAPFVVLIAGLLLGILLTRRWSTKKIQSKIEAVDPALLARVRSEATTVNVVGPNLEGSNPSSELLQDRDRLYAELKELKFDYQAGKLSESDYAELRRDLELKAAAVLQQLAEVSKKTSPTEATAKKKKPSPLAATVDRRRGGGLRGWQIAAGGAFLLVFGLILGIALTKSLRPRGSEQDTMTGDFLTGTSGNAASSDLQEGKTAFAKQDWPKAIEAFKKVLAVDPNQPEAHTYMGFILVQAGHADGALMAFDKALSVAPNLPMALWGKGMTLYQAKQDYAGARAELEKLLRMIPPGTERGEIEKVLAQIPQDGQKLPQQQSNATAVPPSTNQPITGKISIDPKLKGSVKSQAVLFIIARSGEGGGGPPLAVKKFEHPVFPLTYSLGPENVMMQGKPFSGKVTITVRLDQDGNPVTRQPGDLTGEYKNNPVDVGSKNVDVVLDQAAK